MKPQKNLGRCVTPLTARLSRLSPVSDHRCWTVRPAHGHRAGFPGGQSGAAGEERRLLAEQRAAPLALRDPGPPGPRCQEVLRKILRWCYRSYQCVHIPELSFEMLIGRIIHFFLFFLTPGRYSSAPADAAQNGSPAGHRDPRQRRVQGSCRTPRRSRG